MFVVAALSICGQGFAAEIPAIDPPLKAAPLKSGPPLGFLMLVGGPGEYFDQGLNESPATADLSCVFSWRMKSQGDKLEDQIVDFNVATGWLQNIYQSGRTAYPILDTAIVHTAGGWRSELTKKAGQNTVGPDGSVTATSSLHSPIFRASVFNYIDQLIDWVKLNDKERRIPAYMDGAEWFYPAFLDYSPLAFDAFRVWLKKKYPGIKELNSAWGSDFGDWEKVAPPSATILGDYYVGRKTFGFWGDMHHLWVSEPVEVKQDHEYRISAQTLLENVGEGLGLIQFVWFDKLDRMMPNQGEHFALAQPNGKWLESSAVMKTPRNAVKVRLGIKLFGPGTIKFRNPMLQEWPSGDVLLSAKSLGSGGAPWKFGKAVFLGQTQDDWQDPAGARVKTWIADVDKGGSVRGDIVPSQGKPEESEFTISVPKPALPFRNTGVAYEDWVTFSMESMADWLNLCAKHIKQRDPSRLVSSYLGFAWAFHSLWGSGMDTQRADISLANSPDIDINGLQMCIGGDDFTNTTCPLDLARKYGKPMTATDFIDFPYGVYSGFEPHYRGALAAVQHGIDGIFGCLWYHPTVLPYSYQTGMTKSEQDRLLADTRKAIEAVGNFDLQTKVAFIEPIMSHSLADEGGYKGDEIDSGGLYHLILDLGLIPDVVTPYEIGKQGAGCLSKYDLVFLSDCPVLDSSANQAVIDFVKNGGTLIGSGRPPERDFAANPLAPTLLASSSVPAEGNAIQAVAKPTVEALGKGKVYWINDKLGRSYWGKVRGLHEETSTPPIYLRLDFSKEMESLRRHIRQSIGGMMDSAGFKQAAKVDPADGTTHLAVYRSPAADKTLLFLVHTGKGRSHAVPVGIDPSLKLKTGHAWVDFDRKVDVTVDDKGNLLVPDFAHSCIVTFD